MIPEFWKYIKYFKPSEFDSPDFKGTGEKMNEKLIRHLDALRIYLAKPLRVNSGYRTEAHNIAIKGSKNSAHLTGEAVDIRCLDSQLRFAMVDFMRKRGIMRIGIAHSFVHFDVKDNAPQGVIWLYK